MCPILRLWDKFSAGVKGAAVAAILAVSAFAQSPENLVASSSSPADSAVSIEQFATTNDSAKIESVDKVENIATPTADIVSNLKSVLYLGGGERSPWFFLGVLYAIEEYGIPVDSIVGTSWGAWMGSLWARGVSVDEIQRIMLDPVLVSYVGKDLSRESLKSEKGKDIDVSPSGIPALRQRFTLSVDSSGKVLKNLVSMEMDSSSVERALARLRFQESLYRQNVKFRIPFAVQGCDGLLSDNSVSAVISSLPLWKLPSQESRSGISGEICPHYATPAEDRSDELSLIVVAEPLRGEIQGDDRYRVLVQQASAHLTNQPGVLIRSHSVQDTSRNAWIQAGFSAVERKLVEIKPRLNRMVDYSKLDRPVALPWFKFTPSFEGVSSEIQSTIKSHWSEADTGLTAPLNLAKSLSSNPAYDSLYFSMQPNGDLFVGSAVHPTFDLALGGFGSNILGPNAYFETTVNFVDQMEIQLSLKGFFGTSSFGFQPRLDIARLWNRHWSVHFGYDYLKLSPLKAFNHGVDSLLRIDEENRNDFTMTLTYEIDQRQSAYVDFLFGHRTFSLEKAAYGPAAIKTYPVSPMLHYSYANGNDSGWFSREGLSLDVGAGLESIGFDFGVNDVIPIYWKFVVDARYAHSPNPYVTLSAGAAAGIERYHEEGYGYVNPASFSYAPLDMVYRLHGEVTPWLNEWYNPETSSHEYALLRASGSIHNRYFGLWLFGAFFYDFEDSPLAELSQGKFILEPALRFSYKSVSIYAGLNRIVDHESLGDLKKFKDYTYFVRIGEYRF